MTPQRSSCIGRMPGERFLIIRRSYVDLMDGDHCAAGLLSVFEYWANCQIGDTGQIMPRQATVRELCSELMGLYKERAVRAALQKLEERGFVAVEGDAGDRGGRAYALRPEKVNDALGIQPTPAKTQGVADDHPGKKARGARQKRKGSIRNTAHAGSDLEKGTDGARATRARPADPPPELPEDPEALRCAQAVAEAAGRRLPMKGRARRRWLDGAAALAEYSPEQIAASVAWKLESNPRKWAESPLYPRFVAEDMPAFLRLSANGERPAADRPPPGLGLDDLPAVLASCRHAGLDGEAKDALKRRDWHELARLVASAEQGVAA